MASLPIRLLLAAALCAAPPAAAAQDCPPLRHEGRSESGSLSLQGRPGQWYRGWLQEGGREVVLLDGGQRLAAAPARRARLPLWQQADAAGRLVFGIEARNGPAEAPLHIELHCAAADTALPVALQAIARLAAVHAEKADPTVGWQLAWALFRTGYRHAGDADLQIWLLQQQAGLARRASLLEPAAGWAEQLHGLASRGGRAGEAALALLDRGSALLLRDGVLAERVLLAAETEFIRLHWIYPAALARQDRCVLARLRGELDLAIACYREVVQRLAAIAEHRAQINAQFNLTTALFFAGRFAEGRELLATARRLVDTHGDAFYRARAAIFESQLANWAGDMDLSLRALFAARENFQELRESRHVAQTDRLIGDRYSLAGETGRAIDYYRRARRALHELGMPHIEAITVHSEARALARIGELDAALALASEAEQRLRHAPNGHEWRNVMLSIGEILLRLGRHAESASALNALTPPLGEPQRRLQQAMLARLDAPGAASDTTLQSWLAEDLREGRLVQGLAIAGALVERQVDRGAVEASRAVIAQVEAAVLRTLAGLRSPGVRDALLRELQGLQAMRATAWPEGAVAADEALQLVADLDRLVPAGSVTEAADDAVLALERRIGNDLLGQGAGDPVQRDRAVVDLPAGLARFPEVAIDVVTAAIDAGGTFVYPVMGKDHGGLLIHHAGRWRWQPIDLPALRRARGVVHARLAEGHADLDALEPSLGELDRALRLERWLPAVQAVSLVAHAEFAGLPFEWLQQRRGSAGAIVWLQRAHPAPSRPPSGVALIAASPAAAALPDLAASADELANVEALWAGREISGPGHSRQALVEALRRPGALVHVAAHGRSAQQRHEESGLWLQEDGGGVAFVSALRLRRGSVRASLVVLSACETGYSPAQTGLGFGGVAAGLVEAGAGAVVAARWPVGDRAARSFAEAFHRALVAQPERPELALHSARAALRAAPSTRHPTHWAGWFLLRQGLPAR